MSQDNEKDEPSVDEILSSIKDVIASDKDAALMYTFANVFAMQLQQVIYYDGLSYACKQDTTCTSGNKYEDSANTELVNYDGYIFPEDQYAKRLSNGSGVSGVQSTCEGLSTSISYITKITDGLLRPNFLRSSFSFLSSICCSNNVFLAIIHPYFHFLLKHVNHSY